MRTRPLLSLAALSLAALSGACSPEKREALPLPDPQPEAVTEPSSASTAAMAAGGDTMTIVVVIPADGGWQLLDVAAHWDPPYFGHIPSDEDFPLRIVSKNEQGDVVDEQVITEEMYYEEGEEEEYILPSGDAWFSVLAMSILRADLSSMKDMEPETYRDNVDLLRSQLATAPERDSLAVAGVLGELGEL